MGNNSYLPVIARGTAIISLNDQRVLVQNALHVPGLGMPLYSLQAHFQQPGCGFLARMMSVCWCTSLPLCFRLTPPPTALSPMSLLVGRPHFRHSTMFNLGVLHPSTLQNLVHLPTWSPRLRLYLKMTLRCLHQLLQRLLRLLLSICHKWLLNFSQSRRRSFLPRPQNLLPSSGPS